MSHPPKIGHTYDGFGYGQGLVTVMEVDEADNGDWQRVLVEYTAGCLRRQEASGSRRLPPG